VTPGLLLLAWLVAALPLLAAGFFRPLPAVIAFAIVVACGVRLGALRAVRERAAAWGGSVPPWVVLAVLAVVVAFVVVSWLTSADGVIIRRDPQTYSVVATWLASHGGLDVPVHASAFGGTDPGLRFATQGFYPGGDVVVPQFMSGLPATLAIGGWIAGVSGVLHANAVVGGLAILAFAGLVARFVGPRWAPLGALGLALASPELHAARAAFSEPAAQLLLVGGLALVADAAFLEGRRQPVPMFAAGAVLGGVMMVRIDALSQLVPLIPVVAALAFQRSTLARPLAFGVLAGAGLGALDGLLLSRPYLGDIFTSDLLLAIGGALVVAAACPLVVQLVQRLRDSGGWPPPWLAKGLAGVVVLFGIGFAIRPLVQTTRANPASGGAQVVAAAQQQLGLDIDGSRNYYEHSLHWVAWYVGWPALAVAIGAAAYLVWRLVKSRGRRADRVGWATALMVLLGATAIVLWRPSITPDHPWADRRLVPAVLPAAVLLAVAGAAFALRRVRGRRLLAALVGLGAVALLVAPAAVASAPLIASRTEQGEVALVQRVCDHLQPGDVVLTVGNRARAEWTGTLRAMCKVPTAQVIGDDVGATVERVAANAAASRHRVVVMVADADDKDLVNVEWGAPTTLRTHEDERTLVSRPDRLQPLAFDVWLGVPNRSSGGGN
jgi:hypothetical protein